jgi:hypothetical protein
MNGIAHALIGQAHTTEKAESGRFSVKTAGTV